MPPGLSPQVRGNRVDTTVPAGGHGSIPAGAGEPRPRDGGYPSPGSIPAGAGEPLSIPPFPRAGGVYPRRCGGTLAVARVVVHPLGLSPQVRGNLLDPAGLEPLAGLSPQVRGNQYERPPGCLSTRSIPAGAGEPRTRRCRGSIGRVYPRRCGGTATASWPSAALRGLSPQVRGNPGDIQPAPGAGGSIPAGAGEPTEQADHSCSTGVYPRRCGGTSSLQQTDYTRLLRSEVGFRWFTTS